MNLLSRDDFRNSIFERDNGKCVICGNKGQDAHHIIERKLWNDEGYYLDNGALLCGIHHWEAEKTTLSCEEIREKSGIKKIILPGHLYSDNAYDKWGNIILPNGTRIKGELFNDGSVQKILDIGGALPLFSKYIKYPRTMHLPWSPGMSDDDRIIQDLDFFKGKEIVVTEKMDGENTTMYNDYIHARSLDSKNHPSRNMIKSIWAKMAHEIPENWRVCAENLYAKHSIKYTNLKSYLLVFSIWDANNVCLPWDDTKEYAGILGLSTVNVLYEGVYDEKYLKELPQKLNLINQEGYVIRLKESFHYGNFRKCCAKYVRKNHVHTHGFWMSEAIEPNELA